MNPIDFRDDPEREGFISWCSAQARKLRETGDAEGALAILRQGLEKYPGEPRLAELAAALDPAAARAPGSSAARAADIVLLHRFIEKGSLVKQGSTADRVLMSLDEIERRHAGDEEVLGLVRKVRGVFSPAAPDPAPAEAFDYLSAPPPPPPPPTTSAAQPPRQQPRHARAFQPASLTRSPKLRYGLIAVGVMLLLLGIVGIARKALAPAPASGVRVEIRTNPPGAAIRIGGESRGVSNLTLTLAPGEYQAEALLEGYQPASTRFQAASGQPLTVELALTPWKPVLRLYSEAEGGSATLAGRALTAGAGGDLVAEALEDGEFELRYTSRAGEAAATLTFAGSGMPGLAAPPKVKNLVLVLVHQTGDRAVVYTSAANARASTGGQEPEPVPAGGRTFSQLSAGAHQLTVEDGRMVRSIPLQAGGGPAVNAYIFAPPAADKGTLLIAAGLDGAEVFINNRKHWQLTRGGQVRVSGLGPGAYQVRLAREGYEATETRRVEVKAGEETRTEFTLRPIARMATLQISGPAGAEVVVDGSAIGVIDNSGSFSTPVSPGSHSIELRRGAARSRALTHHFTAGETWRAPGAELALVQPDGTVRFELSPAGTALMLRRQGEPESQGRPVDGASVNLPEGSYIVVGSAPKHTPTQVLFAVQPGAAVNVSVRLSPVAEVEKPKPVVLGMAEFDAPNDWDTQSGWAVRRGGNYATFSRTPTNGVFTFTVQLRRGKRLQWFLNYSDDRNHLLFRADRRNFYRLAVVNGRTTELAKAELPAEAASTLELRITVNGASVTHELRQAGQWVKLDEYRHPADVSAGKFGFYIPGGKLLTGSDEYALKDFQFRPR